MRVGRLPSTIQNLTLDQLRKSSECRSMLFSVSQMVHPPMQHQQQQPIITTEQIQRLCKLARLQVPKQGVELEKLKKDLNEVISCLNQLPQDIDSHVPPTYSPLQLYGRENHLMQRWGRDKVEYKMDPKLLLKHAPFTKANCYLIQTNATNQQEEEF
jgi:Asp-tRNA(Asn)/Glu-tRNA(Gln) amidotransferase C subunit